MKQFLICPAAFVLLSSTLFAQKAGDTAVVIAKNKAELRVDKNVVGNVLRGYHVHVDAVKGQWLWVNYQGAEGWIKRSEVIDIDKAIDFFTAAIKRKPISADYNSRGLVWKKKGELDKAIGDYNKAIRLDPKWAWPYNSRGLAWKDKGQLDKAISDFNQAIRIAPKYQVAYSNRGIAWQKKGEYGKAILDYNKALRLDPKSAITFINRGTVRELKGELNQAISDYNEAIRLHPKMAVAYSNRGLVWERKGDHGKAISDCLEAIRLDPKFGDPYNGIAWICATCPDARYRNGAKAVEYARKACELTNWKDANNIETLSAAYAENGEFSEAIKWLEKAIELAPAKDKAAYRSHFVLYKSGKPYREQVEK